jgi:hypothetical protein
VYELYLNLPIPSLPPSQMEELYGAPDEAYDDARESRVVVINLVDDDDDILF